MKYYCVARGVFMYKYIFIHHILQIVPSVARHFRAASYNQYCRNITIARSSFSLLIWSLLRRLYSWGLNGYTADSSRNFSSE